MRQIFYTGGSFLTGDAIAAALLEYAAELANSERAASIWVPTPDGGDVELLLGPASELLSVDAVDDRQDPDPREFTAGIAELVAQLRRGVAR